MKIVRAPRRSHFVQIPNDTARDRRLRRAARGLLAELLSYPDGWSTDSEALADGGPEGRDAIRSMLRELETFGYLARRKMRDDAGRWTTVTAVFDSPQPLHEPEQPEQVPDQGEQDEPAGEDQDGKSVLAVTSENVASAQVTARTGNPASVDPASGDQAVSTKTDHEDPPPPDLTVVRDDEHHGQHARCRACGTTPRQLAHAARLAAEAAERSRRAETQGERRHERPSAVPAAVLAAARGAGAAGQMYRSR